MLYKILRKYGWHECRSQIQTAASGLDSLAYLWPSISNLSPPQKKIDFLLHTRRLLTHYPVKVNAIIAIVNQIKFTQICITTFGLIELEQKYLLSPKTGIVCFAIRINMFILVGKLLVSIVYFFFIFPDICPAGF